MENYLGILALVIGFAVLVAAGRRRLSGRKRRAKPPGGTPAEALYGLADEMAEFFRKSAHPRDLLESSDFRRGVEMLRGRSSETLIDYQTGDNPLIACMALEALSEREIDPSVSERIIDQLEDTRLWPVYFALRALERARGPVVGGVISKAQSGWSESKLVVQFVNDLLEKRIGRGEELALENRMTGIPTDRLEDVEDFLRVLDQGHVAGLREEFEKWKQETPDIAFLNSVGRIWSPESDREFIFEHGILNDHLKLVEEALLEPPYRSVLLVGESGVGKTALVRCLARRLAPKGWRIFEAGAIDVMADQKYIGQLEGRIQSMMKHLDRKKCLIWFVPNFHEIFYAGKHHYKPYGVLEMVRPFVEDGAVLLIGETKPAAYDRVIREQAHVKAAFETVRIQALSDRVTMEIAEAWNTEEREKGKETPSIDRTVLAEALQLAKQYLSDRSSPGNLLDFLKLTQRNLVAEGTPDAAVTIDELFVTLSKVTGLPRNILDDREKLELSELRELFERRVLGQPEAVDCLVERVAMIKSGLTDSTRPSGVFLFAGPTGTGKTEIAKTLSEFLFGSADRMIRLDMSEFRGQESIGRILGDPDLEGPTTALVNSIRKQPFSVVLLDEFEKADPNIWDLFLQVFDDGRLTDRTGNTVDFSHCIIILTSNLGATLHTGLSIGFNSTGSVFSRGSVEKAIEQTFRREFVNRLDRIVIFRPLSRSTMREILHNELNTALQRRGLRHREWAVEYEESAIDFLLERGFTADLGARPLKRAIERYLLSPLAMAIVNHQFPEGDQFLFVRSDGAGIQVEFIDPDVPDAEVGPPAEPSAAFPLETATANVRRLALEAHGSPDEMAVLQTAFRELEARVSSDAWDERKENALSRTSSPGFWDSIERFAVLGEAEYMDRIEASFERAGSLLRRIRGKRPEGREWFSGKLLVRLAEQLYLLKEACRNLSDGSPREAFLQVEAFPSAKAGADELKTFACEVAEMYRRWATKRHMRFQVLREEDEGGLQPYRFVMAVSGFGAFSILQPENGLHVMEVPREEKAFLRYSVRVLVVPQPEVPEEGSTRMIAQAVDAFARAGAPPQTIVRRYRRLPSPLVRDGIRKWRTGRLERVLDGDFDLL